ncbi:unnamed protein product [Caenorhabditis bovis]|uniref:RecQ-mediated genome instability protein 1 n=1 Tax=Caenorhabditis bovis TaxID=2654633 RepID=A0A8S1E786_9PELO|nr:unnamed protein product [Caenorhabditis bovis]
MTPTVLYTIFLLFLSCFTIVQTQQQFEGLEEIGQQPRWMFQPSLKRSVDPDMFAFPGLRGLRGKRVPMMSLKGLRGKRAQENWLTATIKFIESQLPASKNYSDEKFANLVFEQWKFAPFESSSFEVFANHGIQPSTSKSQLQGLVVCQINSIIDVASSFYSQVCKLDERSSTDNTGFDAVFNEKEDDNDKKFTRMLKLTLFDGQTEIKAIEFTRVPQLSLYIKPGCKIAISPPVKLLKGTLFLQSENCQILGGECLPLLNENRPLDQYRKLLNMEYIKPKQKCHSQRLSTAPSQSTILSSSKSRAPSPSPNIFEENIEYDFDDFPNENEVLAETAPLVTVSSVTQRLNSEVEEFEPSINRKLIESPVRKKFKQSTTINTTSCAPGMLTTKKYNDSDEDIENIIEEGEEPVSLTTQSMKKKLPVKVKKESADIEIIELESPLVHLTDVVEDSMKKKSPSIDPEAKRALNEFNKIKICQIVDVVRKMKYCVGSRRFSILAFVEDVLEPLRVVDNLWTMKVQLQDCSQSIEALVDNRTLEGLIGFTCQEAIEIRQSSDLEKRRDGKRRLMALESQLQRLDLVFEAEFFNGSISIPVIRSIKTLAEKLDAY